MPASRKATEAKWTEATVELRALLGEYKDNEIRADARYKSKPIQVTGIVGDVKKDILNQPFLTLGTGEEFEIPVVQCALTAAAADRAARLHKGDTVTVRGTGNGLLFNVHVKNCEIR